MLKRVKWFCAALLLVLAGQNTYASSSQWAQTNKLDQRSVEALQQELSRNQTVRVIVRLNATGQISHQSLDAEQGLKNVNPNSLSIGQVQRQLMTAMPTSGVSELKHYRYIPFSAIEVNQQGLAALTQSPLVAQIYHDRLNQLDLTTSLGQMGADLTNANGHDGSGQVVAILDTGVDTSHPFLASKIVAEGCFSTNPSNYNGESLCPGGVTQSTAIGSGVDCDVTGCYHGTHVAGIAAGANNAMTGVASAADIIAVQVFTRFDDTAVCSNPPCVVAYDSDVIEGLEYVYSLRNQLDIASVNMSLGSGAYGSAAVCDQVSGHYLSIVGLLNDAGIAVVASSGNGYSQSGISSPACVSGIISVGATSTSPDTVAGYTNSMDYLDVLAPGTLIYSSMPNNRYGTLSGTSMAAPHVAGAFAVLKQVAPQASVSEMLTTLKSTGVEVERNGLNFPLIQLDKAVAALRTDAPVAMGRLIITTDNQETVYFNGELVGSSNDWIEAAEYALTPKNGVNVIAVHATDTGRMGGLLAEWHFEGNVSFSNADWKVTTQRSNGWETPTYDDSDWNNASTYGRYGVWPWNFQVSAFDPNTEAQWIWSEFAYYDDELFFRYSFTVGDSVVDPVVITSPNLVDAVQGDSYQYQFAASGGTPPYEWQLSAGTIPAGMSFDSGGLLSGTPTEFGDFSFSVSVTDSALASASADVTLFVEELSTSNEELTLTFSTDNSATYYFNGQRLGQSTDWMQSARFKATLKTGKNIIAVDAQDLSGVAAMIAQIESDSQTWISDTTWRVSTVEEPGWESTGFDDSHWESATSYGAYGVYPWNTSVNGFDSASTSQWIWTSDNQLDNRALFRFEINVLSDVPDLVIETDQLTDGQVDVSYQQKLNATGGVAPYNWTILAGDLPSGITLSNGGEIVGVPTVDGEFTFTVEVQDNSGQSDSVELRLTVEPALSELIIESDSLPTATQSANYAHTFLASGGQQPYEWSLVNGNLPTGLTLANDGTLAGVPEESGTFDFSVEVTDASGAKVDANFSLFVAQISADEMTVLITADNEIRVYINGIDQGRSGAWKTATSYTASVIPGQNVVAVVATDWDKIGGLIAQVETSTDLFLSDSGWRLTTSVPDADWIQPEYDDSAWEFASVYGQYGVEPWYKNVVNFPDDSQAMWIWSADNELHNKIYVRFTFVN